MTSLYSWTARFNYILYNTMLFLAIAGAICHLQVRFGHFVGLSASPVELNPKDIKFELREVDQFLSDRYFKEDAVSFTFDMEVDLTPVMNWNTHTVFATLVCEYSTNTSPFNSVTVWDQRVQRADPDNHLIKLTREHVEYYLTDLNKELKDTEVKIFFRFEHMSTIGTYYGEQYEVFKFRVPSKHLGSSKRQFTPGPQSRILNY
mmetsp:Transcript_43175/g.57116  ORF Transcript_43175/g.57116 Transcript_43175/m.57116 type:complete len:204 (+) Transcript_43175:33-644(+)